MQDLKDWEGPLPEESSDSYHARKEFSASNILRARKSGWEFFKRVIMGEGESNPSQKRGSLVHELVYEGKFGDAIVMPSFSPYEIEVPGKREGTTKKQVVTKKLQEEDWLKNNTDKIIISQTEHDRMVGMLEALNADTLVSWLLTKDWEVERGYQYFDEEFGIGCRFRPDRNFRSEGILLDFKTTQCAASYPFKRSAERYGYYVQAAHYWLGMERLYPGEYRRFIFIAQETDFPYTCGVYEMSEADFVAGINERKRLIKKIIKWQDEDHYP